METLQNVLGLAALAGLAWLISENRRTARLRVAAVGIALQVAIGFVFLNVEALQIFFQWMNEAVQALDRATQAGTSLVFGYLGGGALPFEASDPAATFVLAFRALPLLLVVSALSALLTYWRILPAIVKAAGYLLEKSLGVGGAVGLASAANMFIGMLEAPLFIKLYLSKLTRSELFVVMATGMATIAGTVLVLYATILGPVIPDAPGQLLVASIISAPAAITMALLMVPETGEITPGRATPHPEATGSMDAITKGTEDGLKMLLVVIAMLIVMVALVDLVNQILGLLPAIAGKPVTAQGLLGYVLAPVCWLMGVPWSESLVAGELLGTKIVINELVAYLSLAGLPDGTLSDRGELIMTYAMCGFANFGSLGILIGGLATLVPERRAEIVSLGIKSIVAGNLATCSTGAVVGLVT